MCIPAQHYTAEASTVTGILRFATIQLDKAIASKVAYLT